MRLRSWTRWTVAPIALVCLSGCLQAPAQGSDGATSDDGATDEARGEPDDARDTGRDARVDTAADVVAPPQPVREPTPCLAARDPDQFPIRVVGADAGVGADEPSAALVIFDRSGSMSEGWERESEADVPESGDKWQAASEALVSAVEPVRDRVTAGAVFFPQPDECLVAPIDDARQVPFLAGSEFLATWEEVAPLNGPTGMTPLESAFIVGERAIEAACVAGLLDRRFFVMVLTDGMPNCDTDMDVVETIAGDLLAHGVPTYVFGLPGSEDATAVLDRIAAAGGTETLLVPGSPGELGEDIGTLF